MTKLEFSTYAFREQKRCLRRHLSKPRSMKVRSFIKRIKELNVYLEEFPPDTEGRETESLPTHEIMGSIYHSMPTAWENKMIEHGFNNVDSTLKEMTDFIETRVENLEPKEEKKKSSAATKKSKNKKSTKNRKRVESYYRVVESSEELSVKHKPVKKYCIIHGIFSHTTGKCKDRKRRETLNQR